jgi:hypothetical protein
MHVFDFMDKAGTGYIDHYQLMIFLVRTGSDRPQDVLEYPLLHRLPLSPDPLSARDDILLRVAGYPGRAIQAGHHAQEGMCPAARLVKRVPGRAAGADSPTLLTAARWRIWTLMPRSASASRTSGSGGRPRTTGW